MPSRCREWEPCLEILFLPYEAVSLSNAIVKNFLDGILIRSYVVCTLDVFLLSHHKWQTEFQLEQASARVDWIALTEERGEYH